MPHFFFFFFFSSLASHLSPGRSSFFEFLITKNIYAFLCNLFEPYNPIKNAHLTYWAVIDSLNRHFHEPVSLSQTFFYLSGQIFFNSCLYFSRLFLPPYLIHFHLWYSLWVPIPSLQALCPLSPILFPMSWSPVQVFTLLLTDFFSLIEL